MVIQWIPIFLLARGRDVAGKSITLTYENTGSQRDEENLEFKMQILSMPGVSRQWYNLYSGTTEGTKR